MGESSEDGALILNWLRQTLASNPNHWSMVFTHYPVYSCSQGRDNEKYRDAMKAILEKHGVDLAGTGAKGEDEMIPSLPEEIITLHNTVSHYSLFLEIFKRNHLL